MAPSIYDAESINELVSFFLEKKQANLNRVPGYKNNAFDRSSKKATKTRRGF